MTHHKRSGAFLRRRLRATTRSTSGGSSQPSVSLILGLVLAASLSDTSAASAQSAASPRPNSIKFPSLFTMDDRIGEFDHKTEPGDRSKGELNRHVTTYRPTGKVALISTEYHDGRILDQQFRLNRAATLEFEREFLPHPRKKGYYKRWEARYDGQGNLTLKQFFRPDGSLESEIKSVPNIHPRPPIRHGTPDLDRR